MIHVEFLIHVLGRIQHANTGIDNLGINASSTSLAQPKIPKNVLPFPRDLDFVGRDLFLKTMFEKKKAKKQNEQVRIALLGMGGVG